MLIGEKMELFFPPPKQAPTVIVSEQVMTLQPPQEPFSNSVGVAKFEFLKFFFENWIKF